MSGGTQNSARPPPPAPPSPPPSNFHLGWPRGGAQCSAEVRWERRNFFNRGPQAGGDSEEASDGRKCDGGSAVGAGRYIYNGKAAVVRRSARVEIGTQYNARDAG